MLAYLKMSEISRIILLFQELFNRVMWSCVLSVYFAHNNMKAIVEIPGYAKLSTKRSPYHWISRLWVPIYYSRPYTCLISKFVQAEHACSISGFNGALSLKLNVILLL